MFAFEKEFHIARQTILKAAEVGLSYFEKNPASHLKADDSIVTEADIAVEQFIRQELQAEFPEHGFLGEEGEADVKEISWIVDPIDGTTAYSRGLPYFSNVIALKKGEDIVFTLIYHPVYKVLYHAIADNGAYKNDSRLHVSEVDDLKQALFAMDRKVYQRSATKEYAESILATHKILLGVNAGIGASYVAQGSIDVLLKFYQKILDTAPEYLLMKEAGAVVTNEFGDLVVQVQFTLFNKL